MFYSNIGLWRENCPILSWQRAAPVPTHLARSVALESLWQTLIRVMRWSDYLNSADGWWPLSWWSKLSKLCESERVDVGEQMGHEKDKGERSPMNLRSWSSTIRKRRRGHKKVVPYDMIWYDMRENTKTMRKWSLTQEKVDHHIMMREWTTKTNMMIVEQKGGRVTGWGHFP